MPVRRWDLADDRVEHLGDAEPGLGRGVDDGAGVDVEEGAHLLLHPLGIGGGEVDLQIRRIEFITGNATGTFINYLVEDRDDDEIVGEGKVEVGDCLSLHPLVGVDEQDDALAGQQRAGHLRAEVDVARRVDQVQEILLS